MRQRIGVVGSGLMGEVHARNIYARSPDAVLVAVADADADRVTTLAAALGGARAYTDGFELIAAADVDAVIVASPDHTHSAYTLACVAAGKPVLCEKPLASTLVDAWAVVEAEAAGGSRLVQVGFMREFDPAHAGLRAIVAGGEIGRAVMFRGSHINPAPAAPTTPHRCITQSMIHDFHSARFLTGREVVEVFSRWVPRAPGSDLVRVVTVSLAFDDGTIGLIDVNAEAGYGYEVSAEITGEVGVAATAFPATTDVRRAGVVTRDVTPDWQSRFAEAYRIEVAAWLESLRTGVAVGPDAWAGYAANAIADAACRSIDTGRAEPVTLRPRPEG